MPPKPVHWIGSPLDDLKAFPDDVQEVIGYALYLAQLGGKHPDAKPLTGDPAFRGAGVWKWSRITMGTHSGLSIRCASPEACTCCMRFKRNREEASRPQRATLTGLRLASRRRERTINDRANRPANHADARYGES